MKANSLSKTLLILDLLFVVCSGYLTACTPAKDTTQSPKGASNLSTINVNGIYYTLDTTGGGTGCGPRGQKCLQLMINDKPYIAPPVNNADTNNSILNAPPKTIVLNGKTFEFTDYEKNGAQMLDSKWLIINNRLYKRK